MSRPICKVEIWHGANMLYSITDGVVRVNAKEILTTSVGSFSITLPTVIGNSSNYLYNDIAPNDTVKIFLGYDTVPSTATFVGKIYNISAPIMESSGYTRTYSGKSLGEILERRVKTRKAWVDTHADTIVTELANDLSLGIGEIGNDDTHVTLTNDCDTYFTVLKKLSDYWFDAANQVKKDFYVDINSNLVWKDRPFRTAMVETLTVGDFISYSLTNDISGLKNKIVVYGRKNSLTPSDPTIQGRTYPSDGDSWTWGITWTALVGSTVASDNTAPKIGATDTRGTHNDGLIAFERTFSQIWVEGLDGFATLEFWYRNNNADVSEVRLYCPDSTNYYYAAIAQAPLAATWYFKSYALGENNVYNANTNPTGIWTASASPTWENIQGIQFNTGGGATFYYDIDGLKFNYARWKATAEDATSQTNYGIRELISVDDDLNSDTACTSRAESLLRQLKDPIKRLDFVVEGNTNILVGDRLTITLPSENVTSTYYYPIVVEHLFESQRFTTAVSCLDSVNVRTLIPQSILEVMKQQEIKRQFYQGSVWRRK